MNVPTKTAEQLYKESLAEHERQKQDFQSRNKGTSSQKLLNLTAFDTDFFDSEPPEGLYNVDIGTSEISDFGHLQTFADMNSDKYTDLISVESGSNQVKIHIYDNLTKMFTLWHSFAVEGCGIVRGITVGRSTQSMRLFVICSNGGGTVVKLVDRIASVTKHTSTTSGSKLPSDTEFEFKTLPYSLIIESDS